MAEEKTNAPVLSPSVRFSEMVQKKFSQNMGLELSEQQKLLVQNYFIGVDKALKSAELKRNQQYNQLAYDWANINMTQLSDDLISYAKAGLDPTVKNHLNFIPYANKHTGKYDMGFLIGYVGLQIRAKNQGQDVPDDIQCKLVHKNESFTPIYSPNGDSYQFSPSSDPFDAGDITGGFIFKRYADPKKNEIRVVPLKDILKRKPEKASAEFWGGERIVYEGGKATNKKEKVDGWFDEMCYKTLERMAWDSVPLDPAKHTPVVGKEFQEHEFVDTEYTEIKEVTAEIEAPTVEEKKAAMKSAGKAATDLP